jgi:Transposase DDE domain group 1
MQTATTTSIHKVRRDALGGKRGDGHRSRWEPIVRADPRRIHAGRCDASLTGCAGLAHFGAYLRQQGIDAELARQFARLKSGPLVIYPMQAQMRLLIDAAALGEDRVFGLETWAADPLFVRLAGGVVPSLDTVYRDLARFDDAAIATLETWMAEQGLIDVRCRRNERLHIDVDSTVEPLFGTQQGALPGPNPRYHGRPSYHPLLAVLASRERSSSSWNPSSKPIFNRAPTVTVRGGQPATPCAG